MSERGSIVVEIVDSPALRGNPQGDPAQRSIPVYLPPSYARDRGRHYPTIYWLPGYTGTGLGALCYDPWSPSIPEAMDRAIADGAPEAIVVCVDGFTRFGGSQFLNCRSRAGDQEPQSLQHRRRECATPRARCARRWHQARA